MPIPGNDSVDNAHYLILQSQLKNVERDIDRIDQDAYECSKGGYKASLFYYFAVPLRIFVKPIVNYYDKKGSHIQNKRRVFKNMEQRIQDEIIKLEKKYNEVKS